MLDGEKLQKFHSPEAAAEHHMPGMTRQGLEDLNTELVRTLQKMRVEREDIKRRTRLWKMRGRAPQ